MGVFSHNFHVMAPRKKKTAPAVVGTVSTRSTRRESIINVEIVPRSGKTAKRQTKKLKQINTPEVVLLKESETMEARPEILELLKEWSDDENSQNRNIDKIEQIDISDSSVNNLPDDQQSLIDILEGKQSDEDTNVHVKKVVAVDNPIVTIDSPKVDEPDIIEECVVEDDSFIIEFADQTTSSSVETEEVQCAKSREEEDNSVNSITYTLKIEKAEDLRSSNMEVEEEVIFSQHELDFSEDKPQYNETLLKIESKVEHSQVTDIVESTVFDQTKMESDEIQIDETPQCDNLEDKMSQISLKNDSNDQQITPERLSVIMSPVIKKYNTPKGSPRVSPKCQVKREISTDIEALPVNDNCKIASEMTTIQEKGPGVIGMDSESSENKSTNMETDSISTNKPDSQKVQLPPREKKLAECWIIKRPSRKMVFTRTCSTKLKLIDDTIDEVLRMYTSDDESDMKKTQENVKSGTAELLTSQESAVTKDTTTFMEKLSLNQESVEEASVLEEKSQSKMSFNRKDVSSQSSSVTKSKVSNFLIFLIINVANNYFMIVNRLNGRRRQKPKN